MSVALTRLVPLSSQAIAAEDQGQLDAAARAIKPILRLSAAVIDTLLDPTALSSRHRLMDLISVALQSIERTMLPDGDTALPDALTAPLPGDLLNIVFGILRLVLATRVPLSAATSASIPKPDLARLASCYLRVLAVSYSTFRGPSLNPQVCRVTDTALLDMLDYIIDCKRHSSDLFLMTAAPSGSRLAIQRALLAESASPLLQDNTIWQGLCLAPGRQRAAAISNASIPPDDAMLLDNRPWEMFESLDPPKRDRRKGDEFLAMRSIKDTASLPLHLFTPLLTRDLPAGLPAAVEAQSEERDTGWEDYASERNLGDGLAGEMMSNRNILTRLFAGPTDIPTTIPDTPKGQLRRMSSRLATRPLVATLAAAAAESAKGGAKDPITIDEDEQEKEEDLVSEAESDERPAQKRPRVSSKSTARKTLGGKNVGRKATGGKSVRGMGSKAPRGSGRRRSIVG